ncbi:MAG TPA: YtcA family lipoprotein [Candidatus Eisenbacteria bacterium]|nr:YtcA family lipoprotein [Candidatus Eisenbacteria bacterium]
MASPSSKFVARGCLLLLASSFLAGCSQAPSVDLLGSFFPAWLICLVPAILLTAATHQALSRLHRKLPIPALVYPSLTVLFTLLLWTTFFH